MKILWFRRLVRLELVLIFLVILAGSVVRMTGSGMGCPDWPKCFGYMIPPTDEYQVLWTPNKEYTKGQMIIHEGAMYSASSSFTSGDDYISSHWEKYAKHDYAIFNPMHTWVEYVNRLLGALSGVPMLLLFFLSLFYIRKRPLYFVLSALGLFLLGFEAWLGKEVVDGNLIPGQITYHMMGAFAIVMIMVVFLFMLRDKDKFSALKVPSVLIIGALVLMLIQTVLGTQVREQVDALTKQYGDHSDRMGWIDQLDVLVYVHRTASLLVTAWIVYLWTRFRKLGKIPAFAYASVLMVLASTLSGALLYYFDLPKLLQPLHLMLSAGIVGVLTWGSIRSLRRV